MVAVIHTAALVGLDARPVRVECWIGTGLPGTRVVGLPDTAVRESSDRVRAAVRSAQLPWPDSKVVVNLSPADLPKAGTGFDLCLALAVLAAQGKLDDDQVAQVWARGELGLDGSVRSAAGTLPAAVAARAAGASRLLVGDRDAVEAALVGGMDVVPVASLAEAVAVLQGMTEPRPVPEPATVQRPAEADLADVRGQPVARRALEIAAAGGHHVLLSGPPGCGKSMLARRLPGLLPALSVEAAMETAAIHSVAGARDPSAPLDLTPPFRAPHHSVSAAGLIGGGAGVARPGEASLAHHGVLFLDELLEVPRWILDAMREPLETGEIRITRARASVRFPARFQLIAATNPCPCGHLGDPRRPCSCRPDRVMRYRSRLSGPLLDRIDLQVEVHPVERERLVGPPDGEPTPVVAARVDGARRTAAARWGDNRLNRDAAIAAVRATSHPDAISALARVIEGLGLSARSFDRALRVARTVADLDGSERVEPAHIEEAVAYRLPSPAAVS